MSTPSIRFAGTCLLALALLLSGCGDDDATPTSDQASSPTRAPAEVPTDEPPARAPGTIPTEEASGPEATDAPPTAPAAPADASRRIQFVDGFAQGAALAKEGDILFVYVGLHDPT